MRPVAHAVVAALRVGRAEPALGRLSCEDGVHPRLCLRQLPFIAQQDGLRHISREHIREDLDPVFSARGAASPLRVRYWLPEGLKGAGEAVRLDAQLAP